MSPKKTAEEYGETLVRLDIPVQNTVDIETFKKYLAEELGITNLDFQEALWGEVDTKDKYTEMGIHGVTITYPWGKEVRYGVQGMPGLWGWDTVQIIMEAEEEE
jgi:hypothetical protein